MNVGSLFSGIGGIDEGLRRAGFRHSFLCEKDAFRRGILAERFPGVETYDDVGRVAGRHGLRSVGGSATATESGERSAPAVDLLCGGFPCQDLSVAGQRRGLAGERSGLFFEFARCADELVRPGGYVLIENVPGLLSSQNGRDFAVVLATLAELGFHDCAWRVLDSRHFGVPQRRRRVYVVGRRARGDCCAQILLEPESGGGHFAASGETRQGVAGALSGRSPSRLDDQGTSQLIAHALTSEGHDASEDGTGRGTPLVAAPLSHGSNPNSNMAGRRREDDENLVAFVSENQRAEVLETPYARQLTSGGEKPGQGYPAARIGAAVRRLTPRECERLQGFPDDWTRVPDDAPDSRRYAALGDAVTVNVAEWIGRRIMAAG